MCCILSSTANQTGRRGANTRGEPQGTGGKPLPGAAPFPLSPNVLPSCSPFLTFAPFVHRRLRNGCLFCMVLPETNEQKNLSSAHRELSIIGCRALPARQGAQGAQCYCAHLGRRNEHLARILPLTAAFGHRRRANRESHRAGMMKFSSHCEKFEKGYGHFPQNHV